MKRLNTSSLSASASSSGLKRAWFFSAANMSPIARTSRSSAFQAGSNVIWFGNGSTISTARLAWSPVRGLVPGGPPERWRRAELEGLVVHQPAIDRQEAVGVGVVAELGRPVEAMPVVGVPARSRRRGCSPTGKAPLASARHGQPRPVAGGRGGREQRDRVRKPHGRRR